MRNRKGGTPTSEELAFLILTTDKSSRKEQVLLKRWDELRKCLSVLKRNLLTPVVALWQQ